MMEQINFTLNGKPVSLQVQGEESLLTVIRIYLEQTGTKFGCGIGECGACTVLVDKEPVRSCMLLAEDIDGKEIISIEGLPIEGELHPLQKAFISHLSLIHI